MSFQYINPYYLNKNYVYNYPQLPAQNYAQFVQNPYQAQYQASFYNQNVQYPYNNPNYTPVVSSPYIQTNILKTSQGNDIYLYKLKNGHFVLVCPIQSCVKTIHAAFELL